MNKDSNLKKGDFVCIAGDTYFNSRGVEIYRVKTKDGEDVKDMWCLKIVDHGNRRHGPYPKLYFVTKDFYKNTIEDDHNLDECRNALSLWDE